MTARQESYPSAEVGQQVCSQGQKDNWPSADKRYSLTLSEHSHSSPVFIFFSAGMFFFPLQTELLQWSKENEKGKIQKMFHVREKTQHIKH